MCASCGNEDCKGSTKPFTTDVIKHIVVGSFAEAALIYTINGYEVLSVSEMEKKFDNWLDSVRMEAQASAIADMMEPGRANGTDY